MNNCLLVGGFLFAFLCMLSCSQPAEETDPDALFSLLDKTQTNVDFNNQLTETEDANVLTYEYFYNGGGVAVGDVNGDGKEDLYFSGNMVDNKLYLNKGNMEFEDITTQSKVAGKKESWKTGVCMADVNGDGKLDIYVCYSGKFGGAKRTNELFVNQGNNKEGKPQFTEQAARYGIADSAYSTQATFFDYDHDGDLDMLLLNHNPFKVSKLDEVGLKDLFNTSSKMIGAKLYQNTNNHFEEVTKASGIKSSYLSYGLGVAVSDVNGDGWSDIYLSDDYDSPDYLYINNGDGTFSNTLETAIGHTSQFSMGNDIADINNDGLPDIYTLDMLPEDNHRQKLLFAPDNYELFNVKLRVGLYYQYMRNMLHLNNGNGTFSEVGQLSGISNTDWSWAPLFADYDNDGWKDLFVTNGYVRDYTNMDFLKYKGDFLRNREVMREDLLDLVQEMPASDVVNYAFKNNGDLSFSNVSANWGISKASNSNGAAYADLDNDGDLDLVVNNINQPAFIYRNNQTGNHFLRVQLQGDAQNTQGIGAKVCVFANGNMQLLEQMPVRGYQSSVSPVLHFGLGKYTTADSVKVIWAGGKVQTLDTVTSNQVLLLAEKNATGIATAPAAEKSIFREVTAPIALPPATGATNDFKRQPLMINPLSAAHACLVKGDVNGDGLEDMYAGGDAGVAGSLFIQQGNGTFAEKKLPVFALHAGSTDVDALFFDANNDGKTDLYVASGGYGDYLPEDPLLQDRLYINDGKGGFNLAEHALPAMLVSKSCVRGADINGDGAMDLFVGGRVIPGRYPEAPQSFLLINDGKGHFADKTNSIAPTLARAGMITDAAWTDMNGDKKEDLVVAGEWMPLKILVNNGGKLEDKSSEYLDKQYSGWWNTLQVGDFNKDGKPDIIAGNMGLNTQCKATDGQPAELYYKDFDDNGSVDPVLCFYIQGKSYPYVSRDELLDQLSVMRNRFTDYKSYADASITEIFGAEALKDAGHVSANSLQTTYLESTADGKLLEKKLPAQVQFSPVFAIAPLDFDKDGNTDLFLGGNIHNARLRFGKYDASRGILLRGDGKGNFEYVSQARSGFDITGDIRKVVSWKDGLLIRTNNEGVKAYTNQRK